MNIAIDVSPLHSGHKDRGVGMYTKLLIEALQKYERSHSYSFFTRGQKIPNGIELIHYPYFDPFFVTLPFVYSHPAVVTVHDLIPLVFPQYFPAGIRGTMKWLYQRMRLEHATRIIADSRTSGQDIARITRMNGSRIDVVPLAASHQFRKVIDEGVLVRVRKQYQLPERFVLYVGDVNWNKNILGMLEGFQKFKSSREAGSRSARQNFNTKELKLVLVGKAFLDATLKETQLVNSFIDSKGLHDKVIRIGSAPLEDLVAIYNLASVYIQPSFYEGFGLPVLEAMACGVPVVSSAAASLAEIVGPAIAVNPQSPQDIARGLLSVLLMTTAKRSQLVFAQTKWVQQFSWERVAHQTVISYEKALQ